MAGCASHPESAYAARRSSKRRRRSEWSILPEFRSDNRRQQDPVKIFHGLSGVPALPPGYLRAVERFGSPFFFIQQSVVSKKYRVHAGRRRCEAIEVVRRLS